MNQQFENRTAEQIELLYRDRKMTREEYQYWHRQQRSPSGFVPHNYKLGFSHEFYWHLVSATFTNASYYAWVGEDADKFIYRPVTVDYSNYLDNLLCDYAGDMVDPEGDALRAYERMQSDAFDMLYGQDEMSESEKMRLRMGKATVYDLIHGTLPDVNISDDKPSKVCMMCGSSEVMMFDEYGAICASCFEAEKGGY